MVLKILRKHLISPLRVIIIDSRSIGIILAICTIVSLFLSNSIYGQEYLQFWNLEVHFPTWLHLPHSVMHIINDGLMSIFFFQVGMEIKRELLDGELSDPKRAIMPVFAALGGMIVPAFIYVFFNRSTIYLHGWSIPMATDIAFSLGIASLLGKKVPLSMKIFLTALAIIDDLGAIAMIAVFYGEKLKLAYLVAGFLITVVLIAMNKFKLKFGWWNFLPGLALWYCVFNSGIHATIAGVIFAFTIPLTEIKKLEHVFHIPVNFIIMPVFALANTAILLPDNMVGSLNSTLNWGIITGLVIGKPIGILGFCYILTRLKWGRLPYHTTWIQLTGTGMLAGIGFTMSIFIAMLAFKDSNTQDIAKIGVLFGSVLSVFAACITLMLFSKTLTRES
jgi:Na+:H+ antiporter, NhaA family